MLLVSLRRRGQYLALIVIAVGMTLGVLYVLLTLDLTVLINNFNSVREGSYGSRSAIYSATWRAVQDLPFPLIGNGVKDRVTGLVASMGTHGTYLGLLYRGGWLAALGLAMWLLALAWRSWRSWRRTNVATGFRRCSLHRPRVARRCSRFTPRPISARR